VILGEARTDPSKVGPAQNPFEAGWYRTANGIFSARMQRLFSAFPNSWPGAGLLLLRLGAGASCLFGVAQSVAPALRVPLESIGWLTAPFLVIGLWTPFAGIVQVIVTLCGALLPASPDVDHMMRAVFGASLAMLGPGAWSVDARLFGRKRFDITARRTDAE
jgi:putative oxidoreductase